MAILERIDRWPHNVVKRYCCERSGMAPATWDYHLWKGDFPGPSVPLFDGCKDGKVYYDPESLEQVYKWFREWAAKKSA